MDDGALGGDSSTVIEDFKNVINCHESLGLKLNESKCEITLFDSDPEKKQINDKKKSER